MTNSDAAGFTAPSPMEGHGAYNRSSRVQAAGLAAALPLLRHAAQTVPLAPAPEPVVIAYYGCSEGHNSLIPMREAIAALRQRIGASRTISVVHTDLPSNDFSALFEALESDPDSYLRGEQATFASAVGRSFYRQLLPSGSVTLGWSSWSVQWLSRTPSLIPDQVQIAYSHDANACAAFARQASEDWHAFLLHRADELSPTGQLVVLSMAKTGDGDFGYRLVIDALIGALMDLAAEGVVSAAEIEKMAIPTYGRTRAEFAPPFAKSGQIAGLALTSIEIFLGEDHIYEVYERDRDAGAFGRRWAAFVRASTFPTLAQALEGGGEERAERFYDLLEARLAARLAAAPAPNAIPLAKLLLVKQGNAG
jgi:SAM dependent carboxyl methyltransferase